jgi:SAM-dependent methyltransferase
MKVMNTIGDQYVGYIKRAMGRQTHPNRYFEYAYTFGAIRSLTKVKGKPKLLDVGSGFSSFTKVLNSISDCCANDNDQRAIEHQRSFGLKCRLCDATSLPFEANAFDIVTSVSAIEHFGLYNDGKNNDVIDADMTAVGEITRVLKPLGLFIFTVPFAKSGFYIERRAPPAAPERWYDCKRIKTLLSKLTIKNITFGRYIPLGGFEYTTLSGNPSHIMVTAEKA